MDSLDPFAAFTTEVKSALPEEAATSENNVEDASGMIFNLAPKTAPAAPREVMRNSILMAPAQAQAAVNPWEQPAPQLQAIVPSANPSANPYGLAAYAAPAPVAPAPVAPPPVPSQPVAYSPFDQPAPVAAPPAPVATSYSAPAPTTESIASAYAPAPAAAPVFDDPFGVFGAPAPPAPTVVVPSAAPADDPFGAYGGGAPAPPAPVAAPAPPESAPAPPVPAASDDDDFFGAFFATAAPAASAAPAPAAPAPAATHAPALGQGELLPPPNVAPKATAVTIPGMPPGKQYTTVVHEPSLGVVFFEAKSLRKTIYHQGEEDVDELGSRPVVAFMTQDSAARKAFVKVGHVLLSVNGVAVNNPKEANKIIKETTQRPMTLTVFIPEFPIMFAEGMHMVKYDERTGLAPLKPTDWKAKYIVIGGVIGYHWQMKMYRNQREYDTAVMETFNHHPVSVKVKDFGIHHTCRLNVPEIRKIHYSSVNTFNGGETWYYIAMKSPSNNAVKIAAKSKDGLTSMIYGIKAVIATYNRGTEFLSDKRPEDYRY